MSEPTLTPSFPEVKSFDYPATEQDVLDWWRANAIFARSIAQRKDADTFTFYEGPPTANGRPGIHHVMARTLKDLFCRYKTMKGYRVDRKGGWDTHGLPVEIEVEKALGLEGRHQVEEYGIAAYNAACKESVQKYKSQWDELTERMGYWVDLDDPYVTFTPEYMETLWWLVKQLDEKGMLYQGYKNQWYSPGSNTVLSSHEVSLGYKETQDPSVFVRFPLADQENTYFLAWTTTPWTLPSNAGLAVGEKVEYVRIRKAGEDGGEEHLILAKARLEIIKEPHHIEDFYTGSELVGMRYRPVFDYFTAAADANELDGDPWRVVPAAFVSTEDGTGIVHIAPAYGVDDSILGKAQNLPILNPIDKEGRFTDAIPLVAGQWFKDADKALARDLRERGLIYRYETCVHNYPFDWRKGTPLMQYPVESWFVKTTAVKEKLIALNKTINWQPEGIGTGRFGSWLENNVDWALSRNRYWGTPLPIWVNDLDPEDYVVIGSLAELETRASTLPRNEAGDVDLHRPYVDDITFAAPGGGTYRRIPDLMDVWFDSGAMPFAQWHYPFENKETFEANFPADFIAEGVDQTRGWFYTLHALAVTVMDSVAYKNVVVNGLVLDEKGEKMSKSKGNAVDPFATIAEFGVDPVRWYMMSASPPWENLKFSERGLRDTQRKFFGTLVNTYSFFATYANIDGFAYADPMPVADRAELDRWILSRLNTTVGDVDTALDEYHPTRAARAVEAFVDDLSNWYLRRSRRRFWTDGLGDDKRAAYQTLFECLRTVSQLMAPIAPFVGEWLYRTLTAGTDAPESVHLTDFPVVHKKALDADLERRMQLARAMASTTLALRNQAGPLKENGQPAGINVRQPLPRILVVTGSGGVDEVDVAAVADIVRDEVNVKAVETVVGSSALVSKSAKPNFKALGRRLGKQMKEVNVAVRALTSDDIEAYEREGELTLVLESGPVELGEGDLEITSEGIEGWLVETQDGVTVALDTEISPELRREGLAREFNNRVQTLRKEADFEVSDRIHVTYAADPVIAEAVDAHAYWLKNEALADTLVRVETPTGDAVKAYDFDGAAVTIAVRR